MIADLRYPNRVPGPRLRLYVPGLACLKEVFLMMSCGPRNPGPQCSFRRSPDEAQLSATDDVGGRGVSNFRLVGSGRDMATGDQTEFGPASPYRRIVR